MWNPHASLRATALQGNRHAFAAIISDGSVEAWGSEDAGGDCTSVSNQLRYVQKIACTCTAFAALRVDGSVVAWGNPRAGGDLRQVALSLHNVRELHASSAAFLAITECGEIVSWG